MTSGNKAFWSMWPAAAQRGGVGVRAASATEDDDGVLLFDTGIDCEACNGVILPFDSSSALVQRAVRRVEAWSAAVRCSAAWCLWAEFPALPDEVMPSALAEHVQPLCKHTEWMATMSASRRTVLERIAACQASGGAAAGAITLGEAVTLADFAGYEEVCAVCFDYDPEPSLAPLHPHMDRSRYLRIVARSSAVVVGCISLTLTADNVLFMDEVCVLPEYRRQGIARALVSHVCRVGLEQWPAATEIQLCARLEAGNLYASFGFADCGTRCWQMVSLDPPQSK